MTDPNRQPDGAWFEPEAAGYAAEAALQQILAEHPGLIPGVSADAATGREFQSDAGPADVIVVDADGEVTRVECKLSSNPQIRREIIGQIFAYASRPRAVNLGRADSGRRRPAPVFFQLAEGCC